jgi:hypothetical protein
LGNCKYCGKPAGLLRSSHAECHERNLKRERVAEGGRQRIAGEVVRAIKGPASFDELETAIAEIERSSFVATTERNALLIKGWENAVEQFLEDGLLDTNEEHRLAEFQERFALSQLELDRSGSLTRVAKAGVLRDVVNGRVSKRMSFSEPLPINFQKGEQPVWAFASSEYLEDKTRRQMVGGSQGISVRLAKGVYYRVSAFKGEAVERTERTHVDTGIVVATNKSIYFVGPKKSLRLPYEKIVSFQRFSDGLGVARDAVTAKPQYFITGDGWFTYNLVTNLAQLASKA